MFKTIITTMLIILVSGVAHAQALSGGRRIIGGQAVPAPTDSQFEIPQAAIDTTASYIDPFFKSGFPDWTSFFRLINPSAQAKTLVVTMRDYDTEIDRGKCTLQAPAHSAKQYSSAQLESCAGFVSPDDSEHVVLTFDTPGEIYFQYVNWSPNTGYFAVGDSCRTYGAPENFAANVHTTSIPNYPAMITMVVNAPTDFTVHANIYDASTGSLIGTYDTEVLSYRYSTWYFYEDEMEAKGKWNVTHYPSHVNLEFTIYSASTGQALPGAVQVTGNWVEQQSRAELYNFGPMCAR